MVAVAISHYDVPVSAEGIGPLLPTDRRIRSIDNVVRVSTGDTAFVDDVDSAVVNISRGHIQRVGVVLFGLVNMLRSSMEGRDVSIGTYITDVDCRSIFALHTVATVSRNMRFVVVVDIVEKCETHVSVPGYNIVSEFTVAGE